MPYSFVRLAHQQHADVLGILFGERLCIVLVKFSFFKNGKYFVFIFTQIHEKRPSSEVLLDLEIHVVIRMPSSKFTNGNISVHQTKNHCRCVELPLSIHQSFSPVEAFIGIEQFNETQPTGRRTTEAALIQNKFPIFFFFCFFKNEAELRWMEQCNVYISRSSEDELAN